MRAGQLVILLLAVPGTCVVLGPLGMDSEFDLDASNAFVTAFRDRDASADYFAASHATGSWTLDEIRDRLGEIGFEFDGEWDFLWSRVVLFAPYAPQSAFHEAGLLDPAVASGLAGYAHRDGGLHLVAFDRWDKREVVAHFYVSVVDFTGPVMVIEPGDVRPPPRWR